MSTRIAFRRFLARRVFSKCQDHWPILPAAAKTPEGWPGWPEQKKFALVLTHDVEGQKGLNNTLALAELEESLGFRSSFNFVPEGEYETPAKIREELWRRGFEVGVHDLHHNGKLYRSEKAFRTAARSINKYLQSWKATGFRSGFMHHNLEWLHALDISYDMSTFDTDPFEPQPDGVHTIFPFWVPASAKNVRNDNAQEADAQRNGYVELPYTLPQDSTVFLLLEHQKPTIWKKKLDWIAEHGGMALVNVHPDYICFGDRPALGEYSSALYREFLSYALATYNGAFWPALPGEVADYLVETTHPAELGKTFLPVTV